MQRWLVDNLPRAQQNSYIDDLYGIVTDQPNSVPFQFSFHSVLCSIPGFSNNPYSEINMGPKFKITPQLLPEQQKKDSLET